MKLYDYQQNQLNKLSLFENNVVISYGKYASTHYTAIRIFKERTDGIMQYPFVRKPNSAKTACELALTEGWLLVINGGVGQGLTIENSVLITDQASTLHQGAMPLTIDSNGDLGYVSADTTGKGDSIIQQGIVSAVCGFYPIVDNYEAYDYPDVTNTEELPDWVRAQRQIIGQFGNGDYIVISIQGRGYEDSIGLTIEEAQQLCIMLGLKFAYNLDGGGSVQTVIGKKYLENNIKEELRTRPSLICFNGTNTYSLSN